MALVCIWCANGFQSPWLMWVSIAVYRGVLTFGLRLKMKGCMGIVLIGRAVVGGLLFGCLVVGMGVQWLWLSVWLWQWLFVGVLRLWNGVCGVSSFCCIFFFFYFLLFYLMSRNCLYYFNG